MPRKAVPQPRNDMKTEVWLLRQLPSTCIKIPDFSRTFGKTAAVTSLHLSTCISNFATPTFQVKTPGLLRLQELNKPVLAYPQQRVHEHRLTPWRIQRYLSSLQLQVFRGKNLSDPRWSWKTWSDNLEYTKRRSRSDHIIKRILSVKCVHRKCKFGFKAPKWIGSTVP